MKKRYVAVMIVILSSLTGMNAEDNPFFSGKAEETEAVQSMGFFQGLAAGMADLQRELNAGLSSLAVKVNEKQDVAVFFLLLGIALAYGIIHALGPGHGKIVMSSYVLANPLKPGQGILLGVGIAVIHTLSAVALVSLLYFILQGTYGDYAQEPKRIISLVSYGLLAAMGIFLLVRALWQLLRVKTSGREKEPVAGDPPVGKWSGLVLPVLFIGLVPCEGAVLILIFSISIGAFWLGILLAAVMSVGMAITISATGLITIVSKKGALKLMSRKKAVARILVNVLQLGGAALIIVFGLLLFFSNLT